MDTLLTMDPSHQRRCPWSLN